MTVKDAPLGGSRGEVVRTSEFGPAHWLALDSFRAFTQRDRVAGVACIEANAALASMLGDEETAWRCRDILVSAYAASGRLEDSVAIAEALMAHYASHGDDAARLQILGQVITARFARGESAAA